jgi:hypothetical protein
MRKKNKKHGDGVKLKGFFRVNITEDGKVVGDSGWCENQVTNDGINQYIVNWVVGNTASGKSVSHMALGTGTAPASNATSLSGEITHLSVSRKAVATSVESSRTAQFVASFNSSVSTTAGFITTTVTLQNVGLFNTSSTGAGTILAGNTFATSSVATNQNVQVTYQLRFSN